MKYFHPLLRAAVGLAAGAAALAHGAEPQAVPNPADPGAAVPATRYAAALPYRAAPAQGSAPDQNWKALNRTVAGDDAMPLAASPQASASQQSAAPADHHDHGSRQ